MRYVRGALRLLSVVGTGFRPRGGGCLIRRRFPTFQLHFALGYLSAVQF